MEEPCTPVPSRPPSTHGRDTQSAFTGDNAEPSKAKKKAPANDKKRRKAPSTEEPCTPVPSRPPSSQGRNVQSASTGDNEEPPKAREKKSLGNGKKRRKGVSTSQPCTPVPGRSSSSQARDTNSARTGNNAELPEASEGEEEQTISAKRCKVVQSKASLPLPLDSVSVPVRKRGKSRMTKGSGGSG